MKCDREALLAAVKAASTVANNTHAVPIFTKVWLMEDHVLAFNNAGMVINIPIDMPELGGVDGRLLAQFLDRAGDDEVDISSTDAGKLKLSVNSSRATLAVMEPTDYVHELAQVPKPKAVDVIEFDCAQLTEDMELDAMLGVATLKHEQALDFSSLVFNWRETKLTCYTSDRATINRTSLKVKMEPKVDLVTRLVPIELVRALKRNWEMFEDGTFTIDNRYAIAESEYASLYTQVVRSNQPVDFHEAIVRLWPNRKIEPGLLVEVPEELQEVLSRANLFANQDGHVSLTVSDGELTVASGSERGGFSEMIPIEHPNQRVNIMGKRMLDALPYTDRMFISERGVSMFGPKRFARFISSVSR